MDRRLFSGLIGLAPLSLLSYKVPDETSLTGILVRRWKKSKEYTLAVLDVMPEDLLEFRPSAEQLSFAQHLMHLGLVNNFYIGVLLDSKTYKDAYALREADFLIELPDPIDLFQPDVLQERDPNANKSLVADYVGQTYEYVISSLQGLPDEVLTQGETKEKPEFLSGHSNLDLIIRGESHTAHHRAQAITYLRMNNIRPPGYTVNNKL